MYTGSLNEDSKNQDFRVFGKKKRLDLQKEFSEPST